MPRLTAPVIPAGSLADAEQPEIVIDDDLMLRPWHDGDAKAVIAAFSDPDIQRWHVREIADESEAKEWIRVGNEGWVAESGASWAIAYREDGAAATRVAGRVALYVRAEHGRAEVSYWILPWARQRGIASRACAAATRWAHGVGVHRVDLEHSTRNPASGRVAVAAGFVSEAVLRESMLHADGWHDAQVYSHLATDPLPYPDT